VNKQDVFINVPFDKRYERILLALIAGLVGLNLRPRSVLQIDTTHDRLRRIWGLLSECQYSIHDLSRVQLSKTGTSKRAFTVPRFNMPFETGLAVALAQTTTHQWKIFEETQYRIQDSCSDLNGYEAFIHERSPEVLLRQLLTAFLARPGEERVLRLIYAALLKYRRQHVGEDVFDGREFNKLVRTALVTRKALVGR
jgi:hypothetical protein